MNDLKDNYFLCSGYQINCIFETKHCPEEQVYILTPTGFQKLEEFKEKHAI